MKIYIGADHNGYQYKELLVDYLEDLHHVGIDLGNETADKHDDFPLFAARVALAVLAEKDSRGILLCGSGQGVCIAANRYKGIRAGVIWNTQEAKAIRNDDDSNILCLPARSIDAKMAKQIVDTWLETPFAGASRFKRRIKQLDELN